MNFFVDVLILTASIIGLAMGASWLVDSSVKIANRFGIPQLVIGLTIVAFGTSAPEFGVTLLSAIKGMGDIAVGNIVGSNIFNLGYILGSAAIIRDLQATKSMVNRDGIFLLTGTLVLTIMAWNLTFTKIEGILLLSALLVYLLGLFMRRIKAAPLKDIAPMRWFDPILFPLSLGVILAGSHFLVESSASLARAAGISEWVIGTTIVAFGTSVPELATSIAAAVKGHHGISIGNLLGSDIFNMFGVLGVTVIIQSMHVDKGVRINLVLLAAMVLLVLIFLRTHWRLSRREGIILVLIGLARWVYSFAFS
jgi:cation:H+ antiporter